MVKLSKEKMFISLIVITLIALVVGNVASLATDLTNTGNTSGGSAVISPRAVNNTNAVGAIRADNNTTNNTSGGNTVGSIANNTSRNNTSSYNSTGKLPYAGSDSTVIFVVIALAASALYAYKKVSDYNV